MTVFAQSLKRLYDAGKVSKSQVEERLTKGQITQEEFNEIVGSS